MTVIIFCNESAISSVTAIKEMHNWSFGYSEGRFVMLARQVTKLKLQQNDLKNFEGKKKISRLISYFNVSN